MSVKIKKNVLFCKDETTGKMEPFDMVGSGADKTLKEISEYVDEKKKEIEKKVQETIDSIPHEYTELSNDAKLIQQELNTLNQGGLNLKEEFIGNQITSWLDEHPEATTTVQKNSLDIDKFTLDFQKDYNKLKEKNNIIYATDNKAPLYFSEQCLVYNDYKKTVDACLEAGINHAYIYVALEYNDNAFTTDNDISNLQKYYSYCKEKRITQDILKIHVTNKSKEILSTNDNARKLYIKKIEELVELFNVDDNLKMVFCFNEQEEIVLNNQYDDYVFSVLHAIQNKGLDAGIAFTGERNAFLFMHKMPKSYSIINLIGVNAYPAIHTGMYTTIEDSANVWDGYLLYMEQAIRDGKKVSITETGLCPSWNNLRVPYHWEKDMLSGDELQEFVLQLYLSGLLSNNRLHKMCEFIGLWFMEYLPDMPSVRAYLKTIYNGEDKSC